VTSRERSSGFGRCFYPDVNSQPANSNRNAGLRVLLRTLRYRNYRLFFGGQGLSLIGTWMQQVAMSWLVYRLTDSAFLLGLIHFAARIPVFLLAPAMGVLADRWNRHRIIVWTQTLSMVQAFVLAGLVLSGRVAVWHLVALSVILGLINSLDIPARQSFIVDMVEDPEDVGNAIALNSSIVNGARMVGPSIAGVLVAAAGEGVCFLVNGLSFLFVLLALLAMKIQPAIAKDTKAAFYHHLREGAQYVFGFAPLRSILLLVALLSLMGVPYAVLMPVFAKDVFHGDAHTLGFMVAATGLGALFGALFLAARTTVLGLGRWIVWASLLFGLSLVAFSLIPIFWLALPLLVLSGFGMMVHLASSNTILQTIVEEDKRGRLMSFYAMGFMGMVPFGSLLAGTLAGRIGAPETVLLGGIVCLAGSVWFAIQLPALRRLIQPIYVQKGIIPEVARGIQAATESSQPGGPLPPSRRM